MPIDINKVVTWCNELGYRFRRHDKSATACKINKIDFILTDERLYASESTGYVEITNKRSFERFFETRKIYIDTIQ